MIAKQSQPKLAAAGKYETVAEQQLARARGRIRALDLAAALFGFFGITLLYALTVTLCDRWLDLSRQVRLLALVGFLLGAGLYLAVALVWPLCQRVNPYYAAQRVEQS